MPRKKKFLESWQVTLAIMVGFLKNMNLLESVHIVFKNTDISNMAKTA